MAIHGSDESGAGAAKVGKNRVLLSRWYEKRPNFGDALNPILIELISGVRPINLQKSRFNYWRLRQIVSTSPMPEYMVIGSTLGWGFRKPDVTVFWGPGFMYPDELVRSRPRKVCAVRGPHSREKLLSQGIECPPVYGDPALLLPRFYSPDVPKEYALGIIPHYTDENEPWLAEIAKNDDVLIIDVGAPVYEVVDNILRCERVASTSLHGIIVADAYGVPSLWIKLSDNIQGGHFKFNDYFASVNRASVEPLGVSHGTTLQSVLDAFRPVEIHCDLDALMEACPFRS